MAISTSAARRGLARLIERVNFDRTEIEIVSKRWSAVLISKDEFNALVETSYLLEFPRECPPAGVGPAIYPCRNRHT